MKVLARRRKRASGHQALLAALCSLCAAASLHAQSLTPEELVRRTVERRAVEAVIWGVPAVNYDVMYQAMVRDAKGGAGSNKIVYWSRLFDWKNQTLTPNPDAVYFMAFYDTKDAGPIVLEIPPAGEGTIVGSIDDCWQTALEDVGPAGADKGQGGKYLVLPPDFKGTPPPGYIALSSLNYQGYGKFEVLFRFYGPEKPLFDKTWKLPDIDQAQKE